MRLRTNKNMRRLIGDAQPAPPALAPGLRALLDAGIQREKDCFVFARFVEQLTYARNGGLNDATGAECFVNRVQVGELVPGSGQEALLQQALALGHALAEMLLPLGRSASVIISSSPDETWVRFHMNRPGERWLQENLDAYPGQALAVLTVPARRAH